MSRITKVIATLLFVLVPCSSAGCVAFEEDATGRSQQPESEEENEFTAVFEDNQVDAGECHTAAPPTEVPNLAVSPIAGPPLQVLVDPFRSRHLSLGSFFIQNRGNTEIFLGEITVAHSLPCGVLQTVGLVKEGSIMSDGDCRNPLTFTGDFTLAPNTGTTLQIWADTQTGFDATLAAIMATEENPHTGLFVSSIITNLGTQEFGEIFQSNPIEVRDMSLPSESSCTFPDDYGDNALLGLEFPLDTNERVRTARNPLFIVPLHLISNLERTDDPTPLTVTLGLETSGVTLASVQLVSPGSNQIIGTADVSEHALTFQIPRELVLSETQFSLFMQAHGSRGLLRLTLFDESLELGAFSDTVGLVGCYPQRSDPYLVLPVNEWESLPNRD